MHTDTKMRYNLATNLTKNIKPMNLEKTKRTLDAEKRHKKVIALFNKLRSEYPEVPKYRLCRAIAEKIGQTKEHIYHLTRIYNLK